MIDNVKNALAEAPAAAASAGLFARRTPSAASTNFEAGAQYNFAAIFGAASDERGLITPAATDSSAGVVPSAPGSLASKVAATVASAAGTTVASTGDTSSTATAAATASSTATTGSSATTGIAALVSAIENGSFTSSNVTNPAQLQETTPWGTTDSMPNFYYASDQTASELAQLLGGKVVQMPAFGQASGWNEPKANFVELPNGQTFNAADVAYYGRCGAEGGAQLTADLTQAINEGAAMTNYYQNGGAQPSFDMGYVGPAISGETYPTGTVGADGNVINPSLQTNGTQGT